MSIINVGNMFVEAKGEGGSARGIHRTGEGSGETNIKVKNKIKVTSKHGPAMGVDDESKGGKLNLNAKNIEVEGADERTTGMKVGKDAVVSAKVNTMNVSVSSTSEGPASRT